MGILSDSTLAKYVRVIKESPRELIFNRRLLVTAALYAMGGIPITWDQGSSSIVPSLPGFQKAFGITSGANPSQISNFISFVYLTAGVGSGLSFFINDRIGRLWSLRLYMVIWIVGQLIATFSYGHLGALYTARFVSGLGLGPLTVTSPMSIVEIAPYEIRGLLATWFSVVMLLSLTVSCFVVYASFLHVAASHLQYQIVWFVPCIIIALIILASFFFMYESPRWLMLKGREEEALETLVALRGLPADHPYVAREIADIRAQIQNEHARFGDAAGGGLKTVFKEAFLVPANLRRVQQACISYCLAQLSGANSVTSYLVPILTMMGLGGSTDRSMFLTGMYSMSKFFYTLIASFFFIDALGRRKSLFIGITIQMISDIYIGVFLKYKLGGGTVAPGSSEGAIAAIYIHGFGYAVGLLVLPYVFGAELWPNNIRSFGSALSQCFHWLFYFGVNKGTPSMLSSMHNWGTFLFFAGWCFISLVYVFVAVPETAGLSLEHIDALFEGPFWQMHGKARKQRHIVEVLDSTESDSMEPIDEEFGKGDGRSKAARES
ncbi:putative sugar transporter [Corynespora cassiicola Philippines]|uniref:Putative sugar transporter n=1 Tax=Corynespora cassiicola Philippines TaxID=1448308 RepID=A0A2T2N8F2_CORCC|nr:putative sugar transporter [Corynespora cassiicola Philippines]